MNLSVSRYATDRHAGALLLRSARVSLFGNLLCFRNQLPQWETQPLRNCLCGVQVRASMSSFQEPNISLVEVSQFCQFCTADFPRLAMSFHNPSERIRQD